MITPQFTNKLVCVTSGRRSLSLVADGPSLYPYHGEQITATAPGFTLSFTDGELTTVKSTAAITELPLLTSADVTIVDTDGVPSNEKIWIQFTSDRSWMPVVRSSLVSANNTAPVSVAYSDFTGKYKKIYPGDLVLKIYPPVRGTVNDTAVIGCMPYVVPQPRDITRGVSGTAAYVLNSPITNSAIATGGGAVLTSYITTRALQVGESQPVSVNTQMQGAADIFYTGSSSSFSGVRDIYRRNEAYDLTSSIRRTTSYPFDGTVNGTASYASGSTREIKYLSSNSDGSCYWACQRFSYQVQGAPALVQPYEGILSQTPLYSNTGMQGTLWAVHTPFIVNNGDQLETTVSQVSDNSRQVGNYGQSTRQVYGSLTSSLFSTSYTKYDTGELTSMSNVHVTTVEEIMHDFRLAIADNRIVNYHQDAEGGTGLCTGSGYIDTVVLPGSTADTGQRALILIPAARYAISPHSCLLLPEETAIEQSYTVEEPTTYPLWSTLIPPDDTRKVSSFIYSASRRSKNDTEAYKAIDSDAWNVYSSGSVYASVYALISYSPGSRMRSSYRSSEYPDWDLAAIAAEFNTVPVVWSQPVFEELQPSYVNFNKIDRFYTKHSSAADIHPLVPGTKHTEQVAANDTQYVIGGLTSSWSGSAGLRIDTAAGGMVQASAEYSSGTYSADVIGNGLQTTGRQSIGTILPKTTITALAGSWSCYISYACSPAVAWGINDDQLIASYTRYCRGYVDVTRRIAEGVSNTSFLGYYSDTSTLVSHAVTESTSAEHEYNGVSIYHMQSISFLYSNEQYVKRINTNTYLSAANTAYIDTTDTTEEVCTEADVRAAFTQEAIDTQAQTFRTFLKELGASGDVDLEEVDAVLNEVEHVIREGDPQVDEELCTIPPQGTYSYWYCKQDYSLIRYYTSDHQQIRFPGWRHTAGYYCELDNT